MKKIFIGLVVAIMIMSMLLVTVGCSKHDSTGLPGVPSSGNTPNNPSSSNTLVAKYSIMFYSDGGTEVKSMTGIPAGQKITAPENPTRVRFNFLGWYEDYGTYAKKFDFDKMPARNVCLYAKWEKAFQEDALALYEEEMNAMSENGHLYIHYLRFDNDPKSYEKMSLWVWPKQYTGRTFNWMRDADGQIVLDDIGGAICDVDMTKVYNDAGNAENEVLKFFVDGANGKDYNNSISDPSKYLDKELGFLIVYDETKGIAGSHWTSDGGNMYFKIEGTVRENGSIHLYAVQDNVSDFVFNIANKQEVVNPYENDDGKNVSAKYNNVNSSKVLSSTKSYESIFDTVNGVGYQIMVSSFADSDGDGLGDIRGIIENLDYLRDTLHVDVLWLTPIQLSDSYHGYDIIDYKAVDPKFGSLEDYKELLSECHKKGMKVIMDLVLNHTSINNIWFQNSAKMVVDTENDINYRAFYHWANHDTDATIKKNKNWYQYSEYSYSYYGKFASSMPELNYDYQGTRDAILDVARYWMTILGDGEGVDGFRIDAVKHIYMKDEVAPEAGDIIIDDFDTATNTDYASNVTKNLNFFCWLIDGIKNINSNAYVVGENFDGHAYRVAPYYQAFDGMLDFYMYYNIGQLAAGMGYGAGLAGLTTDAFNPSELPGTNTSKLKAGAWSFEGVLKTEQQYRSGVVSSLFTSNHDLPRLMNNVMGSIVNKTDWVAGTISSATASTAKQRAKTTISTLLMLPGVTWIYYGDELGMSSNYGSGENKTSPHVDRQYRQPFKWTKTNESKYTTSFSISGDKTYYVEWDNYNKTLPGVKEQLADSTSFLNEITKWTKLKSTDDVIRYGDYKFRQFGSSDFFSFTRSYKGTTYWIVCNFGNSNYQNAQNVFGSGAKLVLASSGTTLNYIAPGGCIVVKI